MPTYERTSNWAASAAATYDAVTPPIAAITRGASGESQDIDERSYSANVTAISTAVVTVSSLPGRHRNRGRLVRTLLQLRARRTVSARQRLKRGHAADRFGSAESTRENGREAYHVWIELLLFVGDIAERRRCNASMDKSRQNAMRASRQGVDRAGTQLRG